MSSKLPKMPANADFKSLFGAKPAGPVSRLKNTKHRIKKKKIKKEVKQVEDLLSKKPHKKAKAEKKAETSLAKMFKSALRAQSRAPIDFRINDQDLPEFPNFWEYCTSPQGLKTMPFPRQLWMLTQLFAEWCPHCSDKGMSDIDAVEVGENLYDMIGNRLVLLKYGVCPKCNRRRSKMIRRGKLKMYQELDGCIGQRAGKSVSTSMGSSYFTHRVLKMQSPTMMYRLLPDSLITMTFVGLTFARAVSTLWTPFHSMLSKAPWFVEYHKLLDFYAEKYDDDTIYKFGAESIHYRHRNLYLSPSGPSKRTLRGDTRIFTAIDEIGWFPNEAEDDSRERQSADEVYIALDRSLKTIRAAASRLIQEGVDDVMTGTMVAISSPAHHRDKIMTLVREAEGSEEQLGIHLPTWEFNPNMPRSEFKKEFRQNAIKAERDFGANPPINERPFFSDEARVAKLFGPSKNQIRYHYVVKKNAANKLKLRHAVIEAMHTSNRLPASILSLDAGYSNNSFALAVSVPLKGRKAEVKALIEVAPRLKKDVINYTKMYTDVIVPLITAFNVKAVVTDRWQSTKILHDLMDKFPDLIVQQYALRYEDLREVYEYCMDDMQQSIFLPKMELTPKQIKELDITTGYPHCFKYQPASHLMYQMLTVQDAGNQVVKGPGLTDDLFRAVALGLTYCIDEDFVAEHLSTTETVARGSAGIVAGRSGGFVPIIRARTSAMGAVGRGGVVSSTVQSGRRGVIGSKFR